MCNGELGLFARVAPGPWVTANLNGVAGPGLERPFQGPSLVPLMPFCGWIKEAHVGRPQRRHGLGLRVFGCFVFPFSLSFLKKRSGKGDSLARHLLPPVTPNNIKQAIPKRQLKFKGGRRVLLLCSTPTAPEASFQNRLWGLGSGPEASVLEHEHRADFLASQRRGPGRGRGKGIVSVYLLDAIFPAPQPCRVNR